jgi:hypothetical protein
MQHTNKVGKKHNLMTPQRLGCDINVVCLMEHCITSWKSSSLHLDFHKRQEAHFASAMLHSWLIVFKGFAAHALQSQQPHTVSIAMSALGTSERWSNMVNST